MKSSAASLRYLRRFFFCFLLLAVSCLGTQMLFQADRRQRQWRDDPRVAAVWVTGVTQGPNHVLTRGNPLLTWLNAHGITALGKTEVLTSRFNGEPNGVEIWFAYHSHLSGQKELECHRVGRTAFMDDLGQSYHGFLDFQGDVVGVYLPNYDHAARSLNCMLHWMPRKPATSAPVSVPMHFRIDLPAARRLLPPASQVAGGAVMQTVGGVGVTVSRMRLSAPNYGAFGARQRDLIFHLGVRGGVLAASNVADLPAALPPFGAALPGRLPTAPWNASPRPDHPFVITDPYGVALLSPREEITPMMTLDELHCTRTGDGKVYMAPVNGAGRGTDVVRLHFDVRPAQPGSKPIPFDLLVRVSSEDEI